MFSLVGQIAAHEGAVRSMACKVDGSVLFTGGSDAFVRVWDILTGELMSTISHDHCVTAILVDDEHHYVITGCMDTNIRIFDFKYEEVNRLAGHTKGVISLTRHENILVSGSWDGTAMLWDLQTFQCYRKLEGMENGINVLASADRLITTSTGEAVNNKPCNFRIRIWDMTDGSLLREPIEDHDASIRSVAAVPHLGFVTSSNDGTVRLFTTEGDLVETMMHPLQDDGTPAFIMQVDVISATDIELVSVGEDGSTVVWKNSIMHQAIPHPCTLWCVRALPNGDFLTGAHDGVIRIFSTDPRRSEFDSARALQVSFEVEVEEATAKRHKGPSEEDLRKAPRWEESSSRPGTSEGQVCVFNKQGKLIAAQWSSASRAWVEMGEVVGSAGDGELINGVKYDVVLPVEMDTSQGPQNLKLGYNNGENPFMAAQRFIEQNSLNHSYLNEIADWIIQRTGQSSRTPTIDMSGGREAGGYSALVGNPSITSTIAPSAASKYFPLKVMYFFDDVPNGLQAKLIPKLHEFNETSGSLALSSSEFELIVKTASTLENTSRYHASEITPAEINVLVKLLGWDLNKLAIPFDILRMTIAHPHGAQTLAGHGKLTTILSRMKEILADTSASPTLKTVVLRAFCNVYRYDILWRTILGSPSHFASLISCMEASMEVVSGSNKNCRLALSNLLANVSVTLAEAHSTAGQVYILAMELTGRLVSSEQSSTDVIFACIVCAGTLLTTASQRGLLVSELKQQSAHIAANIAMVRTSWTGPAWNEDTEIVVNDFVSLTVTGPH